MVKLGKLGWSSTVSNLGSLAASLTGESVVKNILTGLSSGKVLHLADRLFVFCIYLPVILSLTPSLSHPLRNSHLLNLSFPPSSSLTLTYLSVVPNLAGNWPWISPSEHRVPRSDTKVSRLPRRRNEESRCASSKTWNSVYLYSQFWCSLLVMRFTRCK